MEEKKKRIFRTGLDYLTIFIKKLLEKEIYNPFEFNEIMSLLSCT